MDNDELVYITVANLKRITKKININSNVVIDGSVYKESIPFFSKKEESKLLLIQKIFKDLNVFITKYYNKADLLDNKIYLEPIHPPAYHKNKDCAYLNSNFINYEIPHEIKEKGNEQIDKFREWFLNNKQLLEEQPDTFKMRMYEAFGVMIDPKQIIIENSGLTAKQNFSLTELENKIDNLLRDVQEYYLKADEKKQYIISKYQKFTGLAYFIDSILPNNDTTFTDNAIKEFLKKYDTEFKRPVKDLLIEYYRVQYNKELKFQNYLLEQLGFNPCSVCYSKKIEFNTNK